MEKDTTKFMYSLWQNIQLYEKENVHMYDVKS
jgi:hypothetical protein